MRTLEELVDNGDSSLPLIRQWLTQSQHEVEVLVPSKERNEVLVGLQVTTRSPMGAIAYETGGILIDHGWLRVLGSGNPKLQRNVVDWNSGRSTGHLLVADDAIGGFFSINGGAFGDDRGSIYYWAPDTLKWEPLGLGYSEFFCWAISDKLTDFYEGLRWREWEVEVKNIRGDECFTFYPFLWTKEGSIEKSSRKLVRVAEQFALNTDILNQLK